MANVNAQRGFTPVGTLSGAPWTDSIRAFLCPSGDSTAIYVGDAVKTGGTGGAAGDTVFGMDMEGVSTLAVATAGGPIVGVVVGFSPNQADLTVLHRVASTNRVAYVCTDPDTIYEVQEDSVGNDIAATQIGHNFDHVNTAGSSTTGRSKQELDSSDASGTSTATFRLLGLVKRADNAIGANAKWLVVANEHEYKTTTGV